MEPASPGAAFRVGDWLVEPTLDRIVRGSTIRHLRPRLMDLLVFLALHPGRVVTKDEILERVWHQRFVAESVLSRSIADLRQLLDDDAERPRFIETIPKRGYRLTAATSLPAATAGVRSGARPSIVVLPFADMAEGQGQDYFCDGLAEELTNALAQLAGLRVVARTSAFAFKGRSVDVREIGRQLDVGTVLEGGVQRAGGRVRVTVQLIDVADGCHAWSERFDRPSGDIFAIEDEIVRAVVAALKVRLLGTRQAVQRRTVSPAAHDLYLKGRNLAARRNADAMPEALACFEGAVAADPSYAAAHAAIAECHCVAGFAGFALPRDVFPAGRAAAELATAIDPDLAEGYAALGHESGMYEWRWADAESHFRHALDLSPGYALARVWYSHLLTSSGRFEEALDQTARACECDPLSPTVRTTHGLALYYARRFQRAEETYLAVLDGDPSFGLARFHLGRLYALQGRLAEAVGQLSKAAGLAMAQGFAAGAWRRLGRLDRAEELRRQLERQSKTRYVSPIAWIGVHSDEPEAQLEWFERAAEERCGVLPLLNTDPHMDPLRSLARFQAVQRRLGLPVVAA